MKRNLTLSHFVFLAAGGLLLSLVGCTTTSAPSSASPATAPRAAGSPNALRVGVAPALPPLIFKQGGRFSGLEADLARRLGAELGKETVFVELPWTDLMDALLEGKVDILMSGVSITPARRMRINFAKPYLQAGQTVLARRTDATLLQFELFSAKTRVGAQRATTGDYFNQQHFPKSPRKLYATAADGVRALKAREIDAFICDAPVNWWLASENEAAGLTVLGGYLTEESLAWGVRKEDAKLLEAADAFLDKLRQSGELDRIVKTWIPYR